MTSAGPSGASSGPSQSDTSLWLHNKLGTSNDSWTGGSIVSQLNPDMLQKIQNCFQDLQPQVKLKLLLSFFHVPRRNLEQWQNKVEGILQVASEDSEPWVCMLSELMKTYPSTGQLNADIRVPEANHKIFANLLTDLKKALKKSDQGDSVLPIECHYLNKNAFISVVGYPTQPEKHFKLKRKPKAAALKADLMNKSQDAANKVRSSSSGSFPMRKSTMPRKVNADLTSVKGLGRSIGSGFRSQRPNMQRPMRKPESGGVKLLDINEQPIGFAAAKKRKRQQELEEQAAKKAEVKDAAASASNGQPNASSVSQSKGSNKSVKENNPAEGNKAAAVAGKASSAGSATPDYAAGLATLNPPTPAPPPPVYVPPPPTATAKPPSSKSTPTYAVQGSANVAVSAPQPPPMVAATQLPGTRLQTTFPAALTSLQPLPQSAVRGALVSQPPPYTQANIISGGIRLSTITAASPGGPRLVQLPTQPIPQRLAAVSGVSQHPPPSVLGSVIQQQPRTVNPKNIKSVLSSLTPNPPTSQQLAPPQVVQQPPPPQPVQQRRSLTLTREQALEAQEMFRTANKVTRPEKALILGFMAGSRDNPCPHLGNVVTIKLSENQENVLQRDQTYLTMIVETHFQMNYSTGEWRRIKKYRRIEEA